MFFWNASNLRTANLFVLANTLSQLLYITTRLPALRTPSTPSLLTHAVAKTFAGIGVLDLLHNTSAAYFRGNMSPPPALRALTAVGFGAAGAASDAIFGVCLVYDLAALAVGQAAAPGGDAAWARLLGACAVGTAVVVGLANWLRPRYTDGKEDYVRVRDEVEEDV
ncbi:hypothetical protein SLS58_001779 [Diplodia intermedia]|uniref:Uncharacterized protein n=1 Tax=Diplodia intermedia TaxID=856260 RepID=A0ABR3U1E6_9PEZI